MYFFFFVGCTQTFNQGVCKQNLQKIIADPDTKASCRDLLKDKVLDAICGSGEKSDAKGYCAFACTKGKSYFKLSF